MTEIESYIFRNTMPNIIEIGNYFAKKQKYRGRYYSEMRCMAVNHLKTFGLSNMAIADIVFTNVNRRDVVIYYLKLGTDHISDEVKSRWYEWIGVGLYPISKHKQIYNEDKSYIKCVTNYKLEKL